MRNLIGIGIQPFKERRVGAQPQSMRNLIEIGIPCGASGKIFYVLCFMFISVCGKIDIFISSKLDGLK